MNIKKEKLLQNYFKILNETFILAYNIKPNKIRKNFIKNLDANYNVKIIFFFLLI